MEQTETRLRAEQEQYSKEMELVKKRMGQARELLAEISEPHPNRKQRSKLRQANVEVLQQWDAYVADHNAPLPALERVRDIDSVEYVELYYIRKGHWGETRYATGLGAWPNQLWYEENKAKDWIPWWLANGGLAILNEYGPLRRKLATADLHLDAFLAEKARFDRFQLYFLLIEFANRPPLFKIGITSRPDLQERMGEIRADLHGYGVTNISILVSVPQYAFLESYFKHKYAPHQTKLGKLTEYFSFDDDQLDLIITDLQQLAPPPAAKPIDRRAAIRAGMAQARARGTHVGRPEGVEANERFLQKAKPKQVASLLAEHPDWSLRDVARQSGIAINTVCKVARLLGQPSEPSVVTDASSATNPLKPETAMLKHPYEDDWAGSHYATTESGICFHITCTATFADNPKAMAAIRALIEAVSRMPTNDLANPATHRE